jgi:hypothetical protein
MSPKNRRPEDRGGAPLPFDITQEIDPALVDEARRIGEATLTQADFDDITVLLPEQSKPRR